jgi:hypothetical protein
VWLPYGVGDASVGVAWIDLADLLEEISTDDG